MLAAVHGSQADRWCPAPSSWRGRARPRALPRVCIDNLNSVMAAAGHDVRVTELSMTALDGMAGNDGRLPGDVAQMGVDLLAVGDAVNHLDTREFYRQWYSYRVAQPDLQLARERVGAELRATLSESLLEQCEARGAAIGDREYAPVLAAETRRKLIAAGSPDDRLEVLREGLTQLAQLRGRFVDMDVYDLAVTSRETRHKTREY